MICDFYSFRDPQARCEDGGTRTLGRMAADPSWVVLEYLAEKVGRGTR